MYCELCYAFFGMFPYEQVRLEESRANARVGTTSSGGNVMEWSRVFVPLGDLHDLWLVFILPFLATYAGRPCLGVSSSVCSQGRDPLWKHSADACRWRSLVVMPVLAGTAMDFWHNDRSTREWYHATVELIVLFLQGGHLPLIIRPLPALKRLQDHGFLCFHADLVTTVSKTIFVSVATRHA